jgi:hypothetical protein
LLVLSSKFLVLSSRDFLGCLSFPRYPLPLFFISVASKGLRVYVSGLESTLAGWFVSVAFKWVRESVV